MCEGETHIALPPCVFCQHKESFSKSHQEKHETRYYTPMDHLLKLHLLNLNG